MLIREVADNSKYYHDTLAAQLPAGLTDDDDILGKAFVIAGMKLGMVKASRIFRDTPGKEQDVVAAYHRLHNELKETVIDDELATAQEIGAQLQSAMEDLYYAHRMGNPNPTVKQNIDMLQKSIRSFNQELNGMGYKYAPTVPGLVAKMGTRYVEEDINIDEIIKEFAPPGGDDRESDEYKILRQLAAQWWNGDEDPRAEKTLAALGWEIGQDESGDDDAGVFVVRAGDVNGDSYIAFPESALTLDEGWGGAIAGAIGGGLLGGPVGAAVGGVAGYTLGGNPDDLPDDVESAYELGKQAAADGQTEEDNPYEEGLFGPSEAMEAWYEGWTDGKADQLKASTAKQLPAPVTVPTKPVAPTKISGPADFSKRGFTSYKKPGDVDEGFRVTQPQIRGTKNRAQSAYYPTNTKPRVPKLDTPLTDKELARLSQLAGIKTNK